MMFIYGGPDQIMGVASGLATLLGLAMMFWNKLLVTLDRIMKRFRPSAGSEEPRQNTP